MTLEQFVTKATLLVDEAGYPARYKDKMLWDTLTARISNDVVWGKIIKKGPDVTLAQVLEISRLETATPQSLSQMSNTKPSVNYVRYDKKRKNKDGKHPPQPQQQTLRKFHGSGSLPSIGKSDASWKFQTKGKICYRCADINQIRCVVLSMQSNNCGKERPLWSNLSEWKGISTFSRSAYIMETSSASTSQTEPGFYNQYGQPIYVQFHMLQTMSIKSQKIPEKVQTTVEIPNLITLQRSQPKGVAQSGYWFRHQLCQSRNFPETLS